MKLLPFLLLSVASILSVRSTAQVVVPPPGIRAILAGPGITVNTNGFTRTISAPGAEGDITGGAVTGGLLTVGEAGGVLTFGLTTNAVRSAVSGIYLPLAGGAVTGAATFSDELNAPVITSSNINVVVGGIVSKDGTEYWHPTNDGAGSGLDADTLDGQSGAYYNDPDNLASGTVPDAVIAAKYRQPVIAWSYRDLTWNTTAGAGWTGYEIESGSSPTKRTFGLDAISASASTDQTGAFKTDWVAVPATFAAFKTTGAIKVTWVSSQAIVGESELRGIRLIGSSDLTGANATDLYADTTTRDITTSGVPVAVSINRSSFASTTVPAYICAQIDASVEDGDKLAIISIEVLSE